MSTDSGPVFCEPYGEGQQWSRHREAGEYSGEEESAAAEMEFEHARAADEEAGDRLTDAPSAADEDKSRE
jgi:hypothetical protein